MIHGDLRRSTKIGACRAMEAKETQNSGVSLKTVNLTNLKPDWVTGTRRELDARVRIPVEVYNKGDGLYFDMPIEVQRKRGEQQCLSKRGDKKTNEFKL